MERLEPLLDDLQSWNTQTRTKLLKSATTERRERLLTTGKRPGNEALQQSKKEAVQRVTCFP